MGVIDEEIDKLKQKSDGLLIQIRAAYEQRRTTLNSADVVKLDGQIESLKKDYQALQDEIKKLRSGDPLSLSPEALDRLKAQMRREWEQELKWLDFDQAENDLHEIIRVQRRNAVLLLLKQGTQMKADLLLQRICNRVLDTHRIKEYREPILDAGPVDALAFVEKWRASLRLAPADGDLNAIVKAIVATLQGSVQSGQILYLRIEVDAVADGFFGWFLEIFWKTLIGNSIVSVHSPLPFPGSAAILAAISAGETPALPGGSERLHSILIEKKIPIVVILTLNNAEKLPGVLDGLCCTKNAFNAEKYLAIRLKNWSEADIAHWLDDYLKPSLERNKVPCLYHTLTMAKRIHSLSQKGVPLYAHNYILNDIINEIFQSLGVS